MAAMTTVASDEPEMTTSFPPSTISNSLPARLTSGYPRRLALKPCFMPSDPTALGARLSGAGVTLRKYWLTALR